MEEGKSKLLNLESGSLRKSLKVADGASLLRNKSNQLLPDGANHLQLNLKKTL